MVEQVSVSEFLGMVPGGQEHQHHLPIVERLLGGRSGSLFGGIGLAAGVIALEAASRRPAVWATGHYLATTAPPSRLELAVELPAVGKSVTQGRVIGRDENREVITIIGACGSRRQDHRVEWHTMPSVPSPERCEPVIRDFGPDSIHPHVELRIARGMFGFTGAGAPSGDERSALWARMPDVHQDAAALAIIADYMPSAVGNSVGEIVYSSSLDNTIRYAGATESRCSGMWVLLDNTIEFVGGGFATGTSLIWSEEGDLLAIASQSMTVSQPRPEA